MMGNDLGRGGDVEAVIPSCRLRAKSLQVITISSHSAFSCSKYSIGGLASKTYPYAQSLPYFYKQTVSRFRVP